MRSQPVPVAVSDSAESASSKQAMQPAQSAVTCNSSNDKVVIDHLFGESPEMLTADFHRIIGDIDILIPLIETIVAREIEPSIFFDENICFLRFKETPSLFPTHDVYSSNLEANFSAASKILNNLYGLGDDDNHGLTSKIDDDYAISLKTRLEAVIKRVSSHHKRILTFGTPALPNIKFHIPSRAQIIRPPKSEQLGARLPNMTEITKIIPMLEIISTSGYGFLANDNQSHCRPAAGIKVRLNCPAPPSEIKLISFLCALPDTDGTGDKK